MARVLDCSLLSEAKWKTQSRVTRHQARLISTWRTVRRAGCVEEKGGRLCPPFLAAVRTPLPVADPRRVMLFSAAPLVLAAPVRVVLCGGWQCWDGSEAAGAQTP